MGAHGPQQHVNGQPQVTMQQPAHAHAWSGTLTASMLLLTPRLQGKATIVSVTLI